MGLLRRAKNPKRFACKPTGLPILKGVQMIPKLRVCRLYKFIFVTVLTAFATLLLFPSTSAAQGLEVNGGWAHVSGNFGMDGFTLGTSWFFAPRISVTANYDGAWNTSRVGTFEFTSVGAIAAKSHIQDFLIGPRVYFRSYEIDRHNRVIPFADARFGVSHLHQEVQEGTAPAATNQDSAFSWMLGGGVDYPINPHWTARGELALLRTHLNAEAQSHARLAITIAYSFGSRR